MPAGVKELPTLTKAHLVAVIKQFKQFPAHVRESCWIFLLGLPCNPDRVVKFAEEFRQYQTGPTPEIFITSNDLQYMLHEVYPIASQTLKNRLEKVCLALYRWSPCLAQCVWLPKFVFPFIKFYNTNTYLAFETCVCVLKSFEGFVMFRNSLPTRELCIINCIIENFFHLPNQQKSRPLDVTIFNQNHPCLKNLQLQSRYIFGLFCSFFTEVLSGDEWLRLMDHIFLNQNVLFIYILLSVFTAREMSLQFNVQMRERHVGLETVDGILRVTYQIYDSFNHRGNADPYQDQPFVVSEQQNIVDLRAIEEFDKDFPQKQLTQVELDLLPDRIMAPETRIRDLAGEVADVARAFGHKYDQSMRASYEHQKRINQSVAEVQEERKKIEAIQESILRGDHLKQTSSSSRDGQRNIQSSQSVSSATDKLERVDREIDLLQRSIHEEQQAKTEKLRLEEMGVAQQPTQQRASGLLKTQTDLSRSKQMGRSASDALLKRLQGVQYPSDYQHKSGLRSGSSHQSGFDLQSSDGILRRSISSSQTGQQACFVQQAPTQEVPEAVLKPQTAQSPQKQSTSQGSHVSFSDSARKEPPKKQMVAQQLPPKAAKQSVLEGQLKPAAAQAKPWQVNMKTPSKAPKEQESVSEQIQAQRELVEKKKREIAEKARKRCEASAAAVLRNRQIELRQQEIERDAVRECVPLPEAQKTIAKEMPVHIVEDKEQKAERILKEILETPEQVYLEDFNPPDDVQARLNQRGDAFLETAARSGGEPEFAAKTVEKVETVREEPPHQGSLESAAAQKEPSLDATDELQQRVKDLLKTKETDAWDVGSSELEDQPPQDASPSPVRQLPDNLKAQKDACPSSQLYDAESVSFKGGFEASRTEPSTLVPLIPVRREPAEDSEQRIADMIRRIGAQQELDQTNSSVAGLVPTMLEEEVREMLRREKEAGRLADSAAPTDGLGHTKTEISYVATAPAELQGSSQTALENQIEIAQVQMKIKELQKAMRSGMSQDLSRTSNGPTRAQIDAQLNAVRRDGKDITGQLDSVYTDSSFLYNAQVGRNPLITRDLAVSDGSMPSANAASYSSQDLIAQVQAKKAIDPLSPCDSTAASDHEELVELIKRPSQ